MKTILLTALTLAAALALGASCKDSGGPVSSSSSSSSANGQTIELQGAGATFPYPLYSKWLAEYQKLEPQVRINYQSIGSGGGIRQIIERTIDFGASDAPMTADELAKAPAPLLHIPMTLGAVVISYNLPQVAGRLLLAPEVLAGIFLGQITRWNDPALVALNPRAKLPDSAITVIHRSDGSGTTAVFTSYLALVSAAWQKQVGAGKSVRFPLGIGAKGNEGVAGQLKTTPGSVGYIELAYARQTGLAYAALKNKAGQAALPTPENIAAAAAGQLARSTDLRRSLVDAPGAQAYPISAFSYILVYKDQRDRRQGQALARFLWWATHEGQKFGPPLDYARLPSQLLPQIEASLRQLQAGGQPLLSRQEEAGGSAR